MSALCVLSVVVGPWEENSVTNIHGFWCNVACTLVPWVSTRADFAIRGHLAMSREKEWVVITGISYWPLLFNPLQHTRQPQNKDSKTQNVSSAEGEKLESRGKNNQVITPKYNYKLGEGCYWQGSLQSLLVWLVYTSVIRATSTLKHCDGFLG